MFTRLLLQRRHLYALRISTPGTQTDRRAGERGGDTEGVTERETGDGSDREREEGGETSARAASHSEEFTPFTSFLGLDF